MFQSTRPVRGATKGIENLLVPTEFQSTRPVRGATVFNGFRDLHRVVSIHAPRAGRDLCSALPPPDTSCFNPRAPCGARPPITG